MVVECISCLFTLQLCWHGAGAPAPTCVIRDCFNIAALHPTTTNISFIFHDASTVQGIIDEMASQASSPQPSDKQWCGRCVRSLPTQDFTTANGALRKTCNSCRASQCNSVQTNQTIPVLM